MPMPAASSTRAAVRCVCAVTRHATARRSGPPEYFGLIDARTAGTAEVRDELQGTALRRLRRRGGAAGAVIALLVIIAVGLRKAWPEIVHLAEVDRMRRVAGVCGTVIVVTGGVLTVRVTRRRRARRAVWQVPYRATVIPSARLTGRPGIGRAAGRPALSQPPRRRPGASPLPGWWEEIPPRIGEDSDEHRPR